MSADQLVLLQTVLSGIMLGCLFGSIAVGLTVKWGMLGIADFSHISLVLLGAYLTYTSVVEWGLPIAVPLVGMLPLFALIGVGLQWVFLRFGVRGFMSLLVTFGLFIVIESVVTLVWSADTLSLRPELPESLRRGIPLPGLAGASVLPAEVAALATAVVLVGGAAWLLRRTTFGRSVHAMRTDPAMAEVLGVRLTRTAMVVSGLAAATASVAGLVVAVRMPLTPQLPLEWLGVVVVAALLGGLGRPVGALVAAIALMVIQNIWSLYLQPSWAPVIAFGILFVYLAVQPAITSLRMRRQVTA
ncbi:MAG: branched-chain amino acid ABC transporter permease [Actinomycetota bacterium]